MNIYQVTEGTLQILRGSGHGVKLLSIFSLWMYSTLPQLFHYLLYLLQSSGR